MRQIYLGFMLFLSLIVISVAISFYLVNRPISCLPDCTNRPLTNRKLRGYDLRNATMVQVDMRNSDLRQANLSGADFSGADMINVNLSNANLTGTRFIGANLRGSDLRNAVLKDTNFSGAELSGANLTRTDLTEAQLAGVLVESARLIEVNMAGVNLPGALGNYVNLTGSKLNDIVLAGSALSNANLSGAVLTNADLSGALLNLSNLSGTDLSGANLAGSSLIGSDLSSANLTGSSMVGANAVGADFSGAILNGTNLTGVRFFEYEITPDDLVTDPILLEMNELQLSRVAANATLSGVAFDEETLWPAGKRALLQKILGTNIAESSLDMGDEAEEPISDEDSADQDSEALTPPSEVTGDIAIIGSSDVLTLTQLIAEEFSIQGFPGSLSLESVDNSIGFERLCDPESDIDILNANRPIRDAELALCAAVGRSPVRFRIGTDAIAMVVNPSNDFLEDVTMEELATIFTAERWNDVNPTWPSEPIVRFIPAGESASKDLFLRTVFGINTDNLDAGSVASAAASDYLVETDDELVLGVAQDPYAIGFLPVAAYDQNADLLAILTISGTELSAETIESGEYALARPLLIYTGLDTLRDKSQVAAFLTFYLSNISQLDMMTSYFISSDLILNEAITTIQEASAPVPTETLATTDTLTQEIDFADIFTLPSPLIPLAPISPTLGLNSPVLPDQTELADLEGAILIAGNSGVLSSTATIAEGFKGLGFSQPITLTHVADDQAFEFFCESDQVDIVAVSHPIQDNEAVACRETGRLPITFRVGTNALAIVTNPNNDFVRDITREELAVLFSAKNWNDVNPDWPAESIQRFIPPLDSSVADLFVEQILDNETDQLLLVSNLIPVAERGRQAQAITTNRYALGFMEYPAYQRNAGSLNLVAVDGIIPDETTIEDGSYPLVRPLLLYVNAKTLAEKPQVAAFLNFYLTNAFVAMDPLNYVPISAQSLDDARATLRQAVNPPETTPTSGPSALPIPTPIP